MNLQVHDTIVVEDTQYAVHTVGSYREGEYVLFEYELQGGPIQSIEFDPEEPRELAATYAKLQATDLLAQAGQVSEANVVELALSGAYLTYQRRPYTFEEDWTASYTNTNNVTPETVRIIELFDGIGSYVTIELWSNNKIELYHSKRLLTSLVQKL